jgi:hypothetical protein
MTYCPAAAWLLPTLDRVTKSVTRSAFALIQVNAWCERLIQARISVGDEPMDFGSQIFVYACVAMFIVFGVTLFTFSWLAPGKK